VWEGVDLLLRTVVRIPDAGVMNLSADRSVQDYRLLQNYPNPFNQSTTIQYHLAKDRAVNLTIVNLAGETVCVLVDQIQPDGDHSVVWDGRNANGEEACSGVYFCLLRMNRKLVARRKISLLR